MKLKYFLPLLVLLIGVSVLAVGSVGAQDDELDFFMISHGGPGNPFWIVVIKGMEDACAVLNANCQWLGDDVFSTQEMASLWDDALAADPDGIGTTAPDSDVIRGGVETANELGIPVIIFNTADSGAGTDQALDTLFYIGGSEFAAGVSNARRQFAEAEADGVEIVRGVCAPQERPHSGLAARCQGVRSVFEERGVPLDDLDINNNPEESAGILADYFAANPETNALFVLGPLPSSAVNLYMEEAGLAPRDIYVTTHDTGAEIYDMIREGKILQTVDQQPYVQGFQTIMWLYLNSQFGLTQAGDVITSPAIIDQSNVEQIVELTGLGFR